MTRDEMTFAVDWAAAEGWNPGRNDAQIFYSVDPQGFFLAEEAGEVVGVISAVAYDEHFGFIGFFIVKPDHRGHRVGIELGRRALQYLGARNVGLDGVLAKVDNYAHHGFKLAYSNLRYEGEAFPPCSRPDLVDARVVPFAALEAFDRAHFPSPRAQFLEAWIAQPGAVALAARVKDRVAGYGVLRPCRRGWKIGPLFAETPALAEELFTALAGRARGEPVYLDVPEPNAAAVDLAERHGMKKVFGTARMYSREAPPLPLEEIFGVTSFELG